MIFCWFVLVDCVVLVVSFVMLCIVFRFDLVMLESFFMDVVIFLSVVVFLYVLLFRCFEELVIVFEDFMLMCVVFVSLLFRWCNGVVML